MVSFASSFAKLLCCVGFVLNIGCIDGYSHPFFSTRQAPIANSLSIVPASLGNATDFITAYALPEPQLVDSTSAPSGAGRRAFGQQLPPIKLQPSPLSKPASQLDVQPFGSLPTEDGGEEEYSIEQGGSLSKEEAPLVSESAASLLENADYLEEPAQEEVVALSASALHLLDNAEDLQSEKGKKDPSEKPSMVVDLNDMLDTTDSEDEDLPGKDSFATTEAEEMVASAAAAIENEELEAAVAATLENEDEMVAPVTVAAAVEGEEAPAAAADEKEDDMFVRMGWARPITQHVKPLQPPPPPSAVELPEDSTKQSGYSKRGADYADAVVKKSLTLKARALKKVAKAMGQSVAVLEMEEVIATPAEAVAVAEEIAAPAAAVSVEEVEITTHVAGIEGEVMAAPAAAVAQVVEAEAEEEKVEEEEVAAAPLQRASDYKLDIRRGLGWIYAAKVLSASRQVVEVADREVGALLVTPNREWRRRQAAAIGQVLRLEPVAAAAGKVADKSPVLFASAEQTSAQNFRRAVDSLLPGKSALATEIRTSLWEIADAQERFEQSAVQQAEFLKAWAPEAWAELTQYLSSDKNAVFTETKLIAEKEKLAAVTKEELEAQKREAEWAATARAEADYFQKEFSFQLADARPVRAVKTVGAPAGLVAGAGAGAAKGLWGELADFLAGVPLAPRKGPSLLEQGFERSLVAAAVAAEAAAAAAAQARLAAEAKAAAAARREARAAPQRAALNRAALAAGRKTAAGALEGAATAVREGYYKVSDAQERAILAKAKATAAAPAPGPVARAVWALDDLLSGSSAPKGGAQQAAVSKVEAEEAQKAEPAQATAVELPAQAAAVELPAEGAAAPAAAKAEHTVADSLKILSPVSASEVTEEASSAAPFKKYPLPARKPSGVVEPKPTPVVALESKVADLKSQLQTGQGEEGAAVAGAAAGGPEKRPAGRGGALVARGATVLAVVHTRLQAIKAFLLAMMLWVQAKAKKMTGAR